MRFKSYSTVSIFSPVFQAHEYSSQQKEGLCSFGGHESKNRVISENLDVREGNDYDLLTLQRSD